MTEMSYLWPLSGGLLIGLSTSHCLLLSGRIAEIFGLATAAASLTLTATASWDWVFRRPLSQALGWRRSSAHPRSLSRLRQHCWLLPGSSSVIELDWDRVSPAATAFADLRGFLSDRLPPHQFSWPLRARRSSLSAVSLESSHDDRPVAAIACWLIFGAALLISEIMSAL